VVDWSRSWDADGCRWDVAPHRGRDGDLNWSWDADGSRSWVVNRSWSWDADGSRSRC